MEKIMRKSNDTSKLRTLDLGGDATLTVRELRDGELENVSGGKVTVQDMQVTCRMSDVTDGTSNTLIIAAVSAPFSIDIGTSENLLANASGRSL
jgi:hypothetical protein